MMNETGQGNRMITAFFDSRQDAESAIDRLKSNGVPGNRIKLVPGSENSASGTGQSSVGSVAGASSGTGSGTGSSGSTHSGSGYDTSGEEPGFWATLKDLFMPDEDRHTYAEGLRRGGYLVTVEVDDAHYTRALDVLDDEGTINLDERESSWRSEGWAPGISGYGNSPSTGSRGGSGYGTGTEGSGLGADAGLSGIASGRSGAGTGLGSAESGGLRTGAGAGTAGVSGMDSGMSRGSLDTSPTGTHSQSGREDDVIPIAQEELRGGRTRIPQLK